MPAKKVLFISHDAARTGAPIIFLNFLAWLKDKNDTHFRILLKESGVLEGAFRNLAPVYLYKKRAFTGGERYISAITKGRHHFILDKLHKAQLKTNLIKDNIGLIYSNTITNGDVLEFLSTLECPVITHVHEMDYWIYRMGSKNLEQVKKYTDKYIAVSEAVKINLVRNHGISPAKIDVIHGFVPLETFICKTELEINLRKLLGIPDDAFIVGGSGSESWRKGKDLFIHLAHNVAKKYNDKAVHFVWVGGEMEGNDFHQIKHDIHYAGLVDKVHFINHVANPLDYFIQFDVFAMLSREDPFPLVNLEVAAMSKPIVCFENSGGTSEFVENDAGFVVPYMDINIMADRIILLAKDDGLRKRLGQNGEQKVKQKYNISIGSKKIVEIINKYL